jgi:N-acetylglucosaminyl-diphospho-decaprenol L-rhamnosyltransferase
MNPRARIVIVTYNAGDLVDASIDSALAQSVACEVVVADNASTDGSVERLRAKYPELTVLSNPENGGFGRGANAGALYDTGARPDFIALLNPDAYAAPDWIERMTAWMDERSMDIGSSVVAGDGRPFFAGGSWLPYLGVARTHATFAGERARWVSGCAMLVRAGWFDRLGGFDEGYFLYSEDVDACFRAEALGARIGVYEAALVTHPEPGTSTRALGELRKHCIAMRSKGRLVRRFSRGLAVPSAVLFQMLVSPGLNGASLRDYPELARAFLEGFRRAGTVRAGQ